eukprot:TRINITY_DN8834_c1_g1_i11.p1 TRINITY_DN8834_c1_g1~~TRINITY_DN8834_c1_g1_i11.p1  ORF type:complete len:626 (-),score=93.02 TRINITY_DN8834_c1_g1_i11:875-2752(-)
MSGVCRRLLAMFTSQQGFEFDLSELSVQQLESAKDAWLNASASASIRLLVFVTMLQLAYIPFYIATNTNQIPAVVGSFVVLTNLLGAWVGAWSSKTRTGVAFNCAVSLPFLVNHFAFVFSETWVQKRFFYESFGSWFRSAPNCGLQGGFETCKKIHSDAWHCESRSDTSQLWVILVLDVIHVLLILPPGYGILFLPGLLLYIVPVHYLGGLFIEGGWEIVALTVLLCLVCMWAKAGKDKASLMLFQLLESQRSQVIGEKIKRCEAEFESSKLQTLALKKGDGGHQPSELSSESKFCRTLISCPARCAIHSKSLVLESECGDGDDCLPGTSRVYVEGMTGALQELRNLRPGHKVLSLDTLTGQLDYVKVSDIKASSCPEEMIQIVLEDASTIVVTADHPMPVNDSEHAMPQTLQAKDLQPGVQAITTWKSEDVRIKEVSKLNVGPAGREENIYAVSTEHPERYKMLVAGQGDQSMIAAGFANLSTQRAIYQNSFLELVEATPSPHLERSASDPELYLLDMHTDSSVNVSDGEADLALSVSQDHSGEAVANVNLPSLGSAGHMTGRCRVCHFQDRHLQDKSKPACANGANCEFCHFPHVPKRERQKLRRRLGNSGSAVPHVPNREPV